MPLDTDSTDDNEGGGGIFDEPTSIFDHGTLNDPVNPQETRAQEQEPENQPGSPPPEPRKDLVFIQDALGNVKCAWAVNGNLSENFRQPTPDEMKLAPQARWRAVKPQQQQAAPGQAPVAAMGMATLGQAAPPPVTPPPPAELNIGKLVVWGGVLSLLGYGAYKVYQSVQTDEEDATQDEMDEADDVEEEAVV